MTANPPTQYATSDNLAARQRLWSESRQEPPFVLIPWVGELAGVAAGDERAVLDVGCGNGAYERMLVAVGHAGRRVAVDLSAGMLTHVIDAARAQADVQQLPFADDAFDLVLAPHMLYHVPDVLDAVRELRRVLRPGGTLIAVTNGVDNLRELRQWTEAAAGGGWQMVRPADRYFSLEGGAAILASGFDSVTRVDCPTGVVIVPDADAIAEYVASVADHYEAEVDRAWSEVVEGVRRLAATENETRGELRMTRAVGAFVCR